MSEIIRDRKKVIAVLCDICTDINDKVFEYSGPSDCFCGKNPVIEDSFFQFDESIINFIKDAVNEKIEKL